MSYNSKFAKSNKSNLINKEKNCKEDKKIYHSISIFSNNIYDMTSSIIFCVQDERFLPEKKSSGAVCRDCSITETITITPWSMTIVWTGLKTFLPLWRHIKVYARSGLPSKTWLMLANGVAVFDADYRGEYMLQLYNFTTASVTIEQGSRVAQLDLCPTYIPWTPSTQEVPIINSIVDTVIYDAFTEHYPSKRGEWRFHSTWQ